MVYDGMCGQVLSFDELLLMFDCEDAVQEFDCFFLGLSLDFHLVED